MATIPEGYRLAIVGPDGNVIESIDLGGYNLDRGAARADLVNQIAAAVGRPV